MREIITKSIKERIKELSEIIKRNPEVKELYMERAKLYDENKQYKKAAQDFKKAYSGYYLSQDILSLCIELGLYEEAEKLYTKAINKDKNNVHNYVKRICFYMGIEEIENAILDCKLVLELNPNEETILALQKILTGDYIKYKMKRRIKQNRMRKLNEYL